MARKHGIFYLVIIISALLIISTLTVFYIRQMDRTISDNTIESISEMAEHDKNTI